MPDYEIQKRTGHCFASGRQLSEGENYYAVLMEAAEGLERRDYSESGWQGPPQGYFCYWRSRIPRRVDRKQQLVDDDVIINLFQRLEGIEEAVKKQFRFVLALILMRKRILKYEQTEQRSDGEYWRMRLVREQSTHEVLNPRLSDEEIGRVSEELGAILRGDPRGLDIVDALTEGGSASESAPSGHDEAAESGQCSSQTKAQP